MLRVGLTGGLGSGKSTAARMFAELGAQVVSADRIGRELMQPGQAVYARIVAHFGPSVVMADGSLDRPALARLAFGRAEDGAEEDAGRLEELNAIVHPATIARQAERIDEIAAHDADAVVIVESALLFETKHAGEGGLRCRFDRLILVTAPEGLRIARFIAREAGRTALSEGARQEALEAEARRRNARQIDDAQKAALCDYVLANDGPIERLQEQVDALWPVLRDAASRRQA